MECLPFAFREKAGIKWSFCKKTQYYPFFMFQLAQKHVFPLFSAYSSLKCCNDIWSIVSLTFSFSGFAAFSLGVERGVDTVRNIRVQTSREGTSPMYSITGA